MKDVLYKTGMLDTFKAMLSWGGPAASIADPAKLVCQCGIHDGSVPASAANRYAITSWQLAAFAFDADGFDAADVRDLLDGIDPGWALSPTTGIFEFNVANCSWGI